MPAERFVCLHEHRAYVRVRTGSYSGSRRAHQRCAAPAACTTSTSAPQRPQAPPAFADDHQVTVAELATGEVLSVSRGLEPSVYGSGVASATAVSVSVTS